MSETIVPRFRATGAILDATVKRSEVKVGLLELYEMQTALKGMGLITETPVAVSDQAKQNAFFESFLKRISEKSQEEGVSVKQIARIFFLEGTYGQKSVSPARTEKNLKSVLTRIMPDWNASTLNAAAEEYCDCEMRDSATIGSVKR
jgi:hypothetical protein